MQVALVSVYALSELFELGQAQNDEDVKREKGQHCQFRSLGE